MRERITEFETVKGPLENQSTSHFNNANENTNLDTKETAILPLLTLDNMVNSSTDNEDVIEIPLSDTDEVIPYDPLAVRIRTEQQLLQRQVRQQAAKNDTVNVTVVKEGGTPVELISADEAMSVDADSASKFGSDICDSPVVVPNENITWQSGIVKRQKQDFEELGKASFEIGKEAPILSPEGPCNEVSGSLIEKTLQQTSPIVGAKIKKDGRVEDPFSNTLDRVFAKEEKKSVKSTPGSGSPLIKEPESVTVSKERESPSRNNSWGSFDSAVVLADRELPSRQSSWGSCDTRVTHPSRNSSFNKFDLRYEKIPCEDETGDRTILTSNLIGSGTKNTVGEETVYGLSRISSYSGSGDQKLCNVVSLPTSYSSDQLHQNIFFPAHNKDKLSHNGQAVPLSRKILYPPPSKILCTSEGPHHNLPQPVDGVFKNCIDLPINSSAKTQSESVIANKENELVSFQASTLFPSLANPDVMKVECSPSGMREEPPPGMVKKQRRRLESIFMDSKDSSINPSITPSRCLGFSRSHSSCSMEFSSLEFEMPKSAGVSRSLSEKRDKFEKKRGHGIVKRLTQDLEKISSPMDNWCRTRRNFKQRSHSLEKISLTSPQSPSSSSDASTSSQMMLDQLVVETEAQVRDFEERVDEDHRCHSNEEISVKNLVGIYEKPVDGVPATRTDLGNSKKNTRPRSDSMGEKFKPPVPQRKSSLDFSFKSTFRSASQPPFPSTNPNKRSPLKQSPTSPKPPLGSLKSSPKPPTVTPGLSVRTFKSVFSSPSSSSKRNYASRSKDVSAFSIKSTSGISSGGAPSSSRQLCSTEMRQRKQQGKTHPLSRLPARDNTSLHH